MGSRPGDSSADDGALGMDERGRSTVTDALRQFVPQSLVQRALSVTVSTDRREYERGEDVEITIEVTNRLPVPVTVVTDRRRIWGWTVDGELEASDESLHSANRRNSLDLRAFETKRFRPTWDGRFKRVGEPTRWVEPDPGEYEIGAFVATTGEKQRDSTTIMIR